MINLKNKIFIDLDDTLLDTMRYAVKWHDRPEPYNSIESIIKLCNGGPINAESTLLGMSHDEAWKNLPFEFWCSIPLMPWAYNLIDLCEKLAGKENVYILSSQIPIEECVAGKTYCVNWHFPEYENKLILSRNKEILVDEQSMLIDDYNGNFLKFIDANKRKNFFLFPSLCNSLYKQALGMHHTSCDDSLKVQEIERTLFNSIESQFAELLVNKR
jgi:5'(3')-deoxyribonucleotidase